MDESKPEHFESQKDMMDWQYRVILQQLDQIQLHASDGTCPCRLRNIQEYCIPKHLNLLASLAEETAPMQGPPLAETFSNLAAEATDMHLKAKALVCGDGDDIDLVSWSRDWRKKIEPIYYACETKPPVKRAAKKSAGSANTAEKSKAEGASHA